MSKIFTMLAVRITFIAVAIVSVSMLIGVAFASIQSSPNPFASYANILPGQSLEVVLERGFHCHYNFPAKFEETCSLLPESGIFSEIKVDIPLGTEHISRAVFLLHKHILLMGNLVRLWGKPKLIIFGKTADFIWPTSHVLTVIQDYNGHFSYWLPITYVAFDSASK